MRLSVSFVIASGALAVAACAGDADRSLPTSLHPINLDPAVPDSIAEPYRPIGH